MLALTPLAAGLLLLAAVIVLGWLAQQALRGQERYQIAFADIDCTPPPNLSREAFLDEVQYFAQLPDSVCVLDDGLPARLSAAFARHPWVEQVQGVEVVAPKGVRVQLGLPDGSAKSASARRRGMAGGPSRRPSADGGDHGCLAPTARRSSTAARAGRAVLGRRPCREAARTAAFFVPYRDRLPIQTVESAPDVGLILSGQGWRVLWGAAPGSEPLGEAAAEIKIRRVLEFAAQQGDNPWEIDVRPAP